MSDEGEDPWGFLPKRASGGSGEASPGASPPATPAAEGSGEESSREAAAAEWGIAAAAPKRAHGEFRAEMTTTSVSKRALPIALALAAVLLSGYLTEVVASSQLLAMVGPMAPVIIFPLGGLALALVAIAQYRYIDHQARLKMIRIVGLVYAAAFAVALALLAGSPIPAVGLAVAWLLADQLNFLLPLLLWSLAGDEFNVAESRRVYPWIVSWTYGGQLVGLAVSGLSALLLGKSGVAAWPLLGVPVVCCVAVAVWLPRAMKSSHAARGSAAPEKLGEAVRSAADFIKGVPVWRYLLGASMLTFFVGATVYLLFLTELEDHYGSNAYQLQAVLGFSAFGWFLICWAIQKWIAVPLQERIGIPGALLILPSSLVVAGVLLAIGTVAGSVGVLIAAASFWIVPRWSVDENARRSALALVPDERRARVSFIIDLLPIIVGLILSGPVAWIAITTHVIWPLAVVVAVLAAVALWPSLVVRRGWEDSLLNWRLRRRKQNRSIEL